MILYDITVPISPDLPTYPGDPPVRLEPVTRIARGDPANVTRLTLTTHSGTHVDVPRHFSDSGAGVDQIDLEVFIGPARVVEVHDAREIGRRELAHLPVRGVERLLLKTGNSALWQRKGCTDDYASLTPDGARFLVDLGIRLVGIDYLSIERFDGDGEVHRLLLDAGTVILEGLDLTPVAAGDYELLCLPLNVPGGDGAPARVVLRGHGPEGSGPTFDPHTSRWPLA